MALQLSFESEYGVTFASAYARITKTHVDTPTDDAMNRIRVEVEVYANQAARDATAQPVGFLVADNTFDETQSLSKADLYTWLKTQPGFENAIDV